MFDVGLASPFKKRELDTCSKMAENIWKIVVLSFVEAWKMTVNYPNVATAARITGIHPVNSNAQR